MKYFINVADIVDKKTGKTIRKENSEKTHKIPINTLVEIKHDIWHGDGVCEKIHARLWVISHDRDCDGTPLYSLSVFKSDSNLNKHIFYEDSRFKYKITPFIKSGFSEESLKVIIVTKDVAKGVDCLQWEK